MTLRHRALAIVVASVVLVSATAARADEMAPRRRLGRDLVISGSTLFAAAYITSVSLVAASGIVSGECGLEPGNDCRQSRAYLWGLAPVVGPWVQLGYGHDSGAAIALYTTTGLVQAGGMAMLIAGLVVRQRATRLPVVSAYSLPAGAGLTITGRF